MNYCGQCGASVERIIPAGDTKPRDVCSRCGHIHYENPRIIAGCLPVFEDKVLLCQRAIEPRRGKWTLPAGFLENAETIQEGAARETLEEANARVHNLELYTLFSLPHISQVYMFYRADLSDLDFSAGEESLAVGLYGESDIPWDELSFPVVTDTLKCYFADRDSWGVPVSREGCPAIEAPFELRQFPRN